uniref:Claudin n=1 Tax=Astyanax mexicanus TaxID=7994 RepID=A0A8B9JDF9_ASTMX
MRGAVEVCGLIVSLAVGFLGCVTAFISLHSHWKESSDFGNVIVTSNIFENLWMSCAEDSTGIYDCWYFQSLLAMSGKTHLLSHISY